MSTPLSYQPVNSDNPAISAEGDDNVPAVHHDTPITGNPLGHHIHKGNEPLPGVPGAARTVDYSPENIEHAQLPPTEEGDHQNFHPSHKVVYHDTPETTTRAYGGSTTEQSGDFKGPSIASQRPNEPLTSPYDIDGNPNKAPHDSANKDVSHYPNIAPYDSASKDASHNPNVAPDTANKDASHNPNIALSDTANKDSHNPNVAPDTANKDSHNPNVAPDTANKDLSHNPKKAHHDSANKDVSHNPNKAHHDSANKDVSHNPTNAPNDSANSHNPTITDKIVGTTEEVAGKIIHNAKLEEKGELRKQGLTHITHDVHKRN